MASIFELHGKPAVSPTPSIRRSANSETKPAAKPVMNVASDQIASPTASTRRAPNRSVAQPTGAISTTYVQ